MDSGSAAALAVRYFEVWNSGDTASLADIVADGWVDHGHPEVTGPESVAAAVHAIRAARPDLRFQVDTVLGSGEQAAVVGSAGGTRLVWLFTARDGRLVELRTFRDTAP